MMECARAESPAHRFCVTARPESVRGHPGLQLAMVVLLPCSGGVGLAFLLLGIWPVTLFLFLPVLGLAWSFQQLERHAGDFERLSLDEERLILEIHGPDEDRRLEFNSRWVQVVLHQAAAGGGNLLVLRSHGREVAFGHFLSDEERAALSRELKRRLARIGH